jgi:hypothetical protein
VVVELKIFVEVRILCKYFHNSEKLIKKNDGGRMELLVIIVAEQFSHFFSLRIITKIKNSLFILSY